MFFKKSRNPADDTRLPEGLLARVTSYIDAHFAPPPTFAIRAPVFREDCTEASKGIREMPAPCPPMAAPKAASLEEILRQEDAGFTEILLRRIDESGKKDSEIYKKANISKQHFSKIRNTPHYKPTKPTALALALALELSLEDTKDLIGRAGFALTNSSKFDLIIRYFIEEGHYDIVDINIVLYRFDQPLLGA